MSDLIFPYITLVYNLYMFFPCIPAISSLCQDETEAQVEKLKDAAARASVIGLEGRLRDIGRPSYLLEL